MELLRLNSDMDELIARRATAREMRKLAFDMGFRTLADDGMRRVLDGSTSIEELGRVVEGCVAGEALLEALEQVDKPGIGQCCRLFHLEVAFQARGFQVEIDGQHA